MTDHDLETARLVVDRGAALNAPPLVVRIADELARERRRCCAAVCPWCAKKIAVERVRGRWRHRQGSVLLGGDPGDEPACRAGAIRDLT